MRRASLGLVYVVATLFGATTALASHYFATVTWPTNGSSETNPCHGDAFYFKTSDGWGRSCAGGKDRGNGGSDANVYIRGSNWSQAKLTGAYWNYVYTALTCDGTVHTEYGNAWEITLADGTAGAAFHHLSGHHYTVGSTVSSGTDVADQANWPLYPVYYCSGVKASTGPHIHMEAARKGTLLDAWESTGVKYTHSDIAP